MVILVSGATGFLGKNLISKLVKNHSLLIFSTGKSKINPRKIIKSKQIFYCDLSNYQNKIKQHKPKIFLNLQVRFSYYHDETILKEMVNSNLSIPINLLQCAAENGLKRLISPTTFVAFDKNRKYNPANVFAGTKQAFAVLADALARIFQFQFDEVIMFDTFGENDNRKKILNIFAESIKNNKKLSLSPGNQMLDITHIDTIVSGFANLINKKIKNKYSKNIYFASGLNRLTLKNLAKLIEKCSNKKLYANWGALNYRKNEVLSPVKVIKKLNICKKENLKKKINIFLKKY